MMVKAMDFEMLIALRLGYRSAVDERLALNHKEDANSTHTGPLRRRAALPRRVDFLQKLLLLFYAGAGHGCSPSIVAANVSSAFDFDRDFLCHFDRGFHGQGLLRWMFRFPAQGRGEAQRFDVEDFKRLADIAHFPFSPWAGGRQRGNGSHHSVRFVTSDSGQLLPSDQ
jgi:hypothetical protein